MVVGICFLPPAEQLAESGFGVDSMPYMPVKDRSID